MAVESEPCPARHRAVSVTTSARGLLATEVEVEARWVSEAQGIVSHIRIPIQRLWICRVTARRIGLHEASEA